jgi:hypothetical protein
MIRKGEKRNAYRVLIGKAGDCLEYLGIAGRIILKLILKEEHGIM